ncbi:MAG: ATP-binding protein [Candidatus Cloacimonetes bacterium]|nr:ATP-binding protein [Candidatus Cloacimonadota bacterium]
MKNTFFLKIFSASVALIIMITTIILVINFHIIHSNYKKTTTKNLSNILEVFNVNIAEHLENNTIVELNDLLSDISQSTGVRFTIIKNDGQIIAESDKDYLKMENHNNRPEIIQAMQNKTGIASRYSSSLNAEMLYIAKPIFKNDKLIAVTRVSYLLRDIKDITDNIFLNVLKFGVILVFISLLLVYWFSKSLSKPIKKLVNSSKKIAKGDFNAKVLLKNTDEFGFLAQNFNLMIDKLNSQMQELNNQKDELNNIISSINEPLCVINNNAEIILCNKSFKDFMLNCTSDLSHYWEAIKSPEIKEFIRKTYQDEKIQTLELKIDNNYYLAKVSKVLSKNETIFIFYNITELKALEQVKKDLIENVSHELRTPLTAINGFLESLDFEKQENVEIINIIKRNTLRLINLTQDLLVLSKLEHSVIAEKHNVNINNLIEQIKKMFVKAMSEKKIDFIVNTSSDEIIVYANEYELEQLIINLLQNALQYTEKGYIKLEIILQNTNNLVLRVSDSGIGIPTKDLDRIFERFYVVNKSRSKKHSGTGLGLSIVKHIILQYNGKINVQSEEAKGTTFEISLPIIK